jgi:hypothetical protein
MKSTPAAEPVLVEPESAAGTSLLGSFSGVGTSSPSKDPADSSKNLSCPGAGAGVFSDSTTPTEDEEDASSDEVCADDSANSSVHFISFYSCSSDLQ